MRPEQEMAERNNLIARAAELIRDSKAGTPKERSEKAVELLRQAETIALAGYAPLNEWHNPSDLLEINQLQSRLDACQSSREWLQEQNTIEQKHSAELQSRLDAIAKRNAELELSINDIRHAMEHATEIGRMDHYSANTINQACAVVERREHYSDCAVHNGPAYPPGPCDCGGVERQSHITEDVKRYGGEAPPPLDLPTVYGVEKPMRERPYDPATDCIVCGSPDHIRHPRE